MTIPTKKLTNGFKMPVYGLGTWQIGGRYQRDPKSDENENIALIKTAIDLGVSHIDTAELYANGYTEELIGRAIAGFDRSKLFLVSKVYTPKHARYEDVINACKNSLKRLNTTYLDLYLTHRYNPLEVSYKETMRAMDKLVDEGLVKNIGFSNYSISDIQKAQSYAKHKLVAGQMHYNLQIREIEKKKILKYCQRNDIMLIAWRPVQIHNLIKNPPQIVLELMKKYKKTAIQIAINWLISQKNVVAISKTTNIKHLKENLGAVGWNMKKEDIEKLRKEYPDQQDVSDTMSLD